jgi:PLD-like domain
MLQKALFHNHAKVILHQLHQAVRSIDVAMCWFSNPMLFSLLMKKAQEGIAIRLLLQYDQANFHPKGLKFLELIQAGGQLFVYHQSGKLFHHKFCIIDHNKLITGSYNWTLSSSEDNLIITEHPDLLQSYQAAFDRLWQQATPLINLANVVPPPPPFHKLFEPILWNRHDLRHAILWGGRVWVAVFKEKEMAIWEDCLQQQRHFLKCKADFFETNKGIWEATAFKNWLTDLPLSKKRLLVNYCQRAKAGDVLVAVAESGLLLGAGLLGLHLEPGSRPDYAFARYVQWFEYQEEVAWLDVVPKAAFSVYRGSGLRLVNGLLESYLKRLIRQDKQEKQAFLSA